MSRSFINPLQNGEETGENKDKKFLLELQHLCNKTLKRNKKKWQKQNAECEHAQKGQCFQQIADSLLVEAVNIQKGKTQIWLKNVHTQQQEQVSLNPKYDAHGNAQIYYKKAKKAKRSLEICEEKLQKTSEEIRILETVMTQIQKAQTIELSDEAYENVCSEIKKNLQHCGLAEYTQLQKKQNKTESKVPFRHYVIDQWDIYIGKNDTQNDELTTRFARPHDLWLHVVAHAGSHVVIKNNRNAPWPPQNILEKAASLAAWFSKAKHASYVEVHATEKRYVYKRRKAPPGEVIASQCKIIRVTPKSPKELIETERH